MITACAHVYAALAALAALTAFLMVDHRSVYSSQRLGFSKSAGLELDLDRPIGDVKRSDVRIRKGTLFASLRAPSSRRSRRGPGRLCLYTHAWWRRRQKSDFGQRCSRE